MLMKLWSGKFLERILPAEVNAHENIPTREIMLKATIKIYASLKFLFIRKGTP